MPAFFSPEAVEFLESARFTCRSTSADDGSSGGSAALLPVDALSLMDLVVHANTVYAVFNRALAASEAELSERDDASAITTTTSTTHPSVASRRRRAVEPQNASHRLLAAQDAFTRGLGCHVLGPSLLVCLLCYVDPTAFDTASIKRDVRTLLDQGRSPYRYEGDDADASDDSDEVSDNDNANDNDDEEAEGRSSSGAAADGAWPPSAGTLHRWRAERREARAGGQPVSHIAPLLLSISKALWNTYAQVQSVLSAAASRPPGGNFSSPPNELQQQNRKVAAVSLSHVLGQQGLSRVPWLTSQRVQTNASLLNRCALVRLPQDGKGSGGGQIATGVGNADGGGGGGGAPDRAGLVINHRPRGGNGFGTTEARRLPPPPPRASQRALLRDPFSAAPVSKKRPRRTDSDTSNINNNVNLNLCGAVSKEKVHLAFPSITTDDTNSNNEGTLSCLPDELLEHLLGFVPPSHAASVLPGVCGRWRRLVFHRSPLLRFYAAAARHVTRAYERFFLGEWGEVAMLMESATTLSRLATATTTTTISNTMAITINNKVDCGGTGRPVNVAGLLAEHSKLHEALEYMHNASNTGRSWRSENSEAVELLDTYLSSLPSASPAFSSAEADCFILSRCPEHSLPRRRLALMVRLLATEVKIMGVSAAPGNCSSSSSSARRLFQTAQADLFANAFRGPLGPATAALRFASERVAVWAELEPRMRLLL